MNLSKDSVQLFVHRMFRIINSSKILLFFVLVSLLYGFIVWRINVLASAEPSEEALYSAQKTSSAPKIDQNVINKIYSLKDNSVRVQTLFEEARDNPFNE